MQLVLKAKRMRSCGLRVVSSDYKSALEEENKYDSLETLNEFGIIMLKNINHVPILNNNSIFEIY